MPEGRHLLLLLGAGLFLMIGHIAISAAYRTGDPGVVAPFYYMFAVWAVISGLVVFNTVPNTAGVRRHRDDPRQRRHRGAARRAQAAQAAGAGLEVAMARPATTSRASH